MQRHNNALATYNIIHLFVVVLFLFDADIPKSIRDTLQQFGHTGFRPNQENIITNILTGMIMQR